MGGISMGRLGQVNLSPLFYNLNTLDEHFNTDSRWRWIYHTAKTRDHGPVFGKDACSHPIKNTTLQDKKNQIRNFDRCLHKFYSFAKNHNWIDQYNAIYDFWNKKHLC